MKLEIKERGNDKFYDEFLSVVSNINKIRNNPKKRINGITKDALMYILISFVFGVGFFIVSYYKVYNYYKISIFFGIIFVLSILYYFLIKNRINKLRNQKGIMVLEINKNSVMLTFDGKKHELKWNEIKNVVINKYTISFVSNNKFVITVNIDYLDRIIGGIKKYNYDNLVVDNTDLYK